MTVSMLELILPGASGPPCFLPVDRDGTWTRLVDGRWPGLGSSALLQLLFLMLLGVHPPSSPVKDPWVSRFSRRQPDSYTGSTGLHGLPVADRFT